MKLQKNHGMTSSLPQAIKTRLAKQDYSICCLLPELPLCVFENNGPEPKAVYVESEGAKSVYYANHSARMQGIQPGLSLDQAIEKAPSLIGKPRNQKSEWCEAAKIATHLSEFTPFLTIETDHKNTYIRLEMKQALYSEEKLKALSIGLSQKMNGAYQTLLFGVGPTVESAKAFAQQFPNTWSFIINAPLYWQQWHQLKLIHLDFDKNTILNLSNKGIETVNDLVKQYQNNPTLDRPPLSDKKTLGSKALKPLLELLNQKQIEYWLKLCAFQPNTSKTKAVCPTYCDSLSLKEMLPPISKNVIPYLKTLLDGLEVFLLQHQAVVLCYDLHLLDTFERSSSVRICLKTPQYRSKELLDAAILRLSQFPNQKTFNEIQLTSTELIQKSLIKDQKPVSIKLNELTSEEIDQFQKRLILSTIKKLSISNNKRTSEDIHSGKINQIHKLEGIIGYISDGKASSRSRLFGFLEYSAIEFPALPITKKNTQCWELKCKETHMKKLWLKTMKTPFNTGSMTIVEGPFHLNTGLWNKKPTYRNFYIARNTIQNLFWIYQDDNQQWFLQALLYKNTNTNNQHKTPTTN